MLDGGIQLLGCRNGGESSLVEIDLRDFGVLAVEDLGDLLERRAAGLDVQEVHEHELEGDPALFFS